MLSCYGDSCTHDWFHSEGQKIGAINGVIRLLQRMDKTHRPEHICVFFDSATRPTTRKLMDPSYKSSRPPTPNTLRQQLSSATEVLKAGQVNCIFSPGFEADDLIASYVDSYYASGYDVLIISNDNDFMQLARGPEVQREYTQSAEEVTNKESTATPRADADWSLESPSTGPIVEIYQPNRRRYVRARHVQSRFGLRAALLPDYFALVGTKWGKIRKVNHMTEELAVQLLTEHDGLWPLLRNLNKVEDPVIRTALKEAISSIELSYRIAKLSTDVPLPHAIGELQSPQVEQLVASDAA